MLGLLLLLLPQLLRLHAISAFVLHVRLHQRLPLLSDHAVILLLVLRCLLINQLHLHQSCLVWPIYPISIGIYLNRVDCTLRCHLLSSQRLHLPRVVARIQTVLLSSRGVILTDASILHRTISDNLVCLHFTLFFNGYGCWPYMMRIDQRFHFALLLLHLVGLWIACLISHLCWLATIDLVASLSKFLIFLILCQRPRSVDVHQLPTAIHQNWWFLLISRTDAIKWLSAQHCWLILIVIIRILSFHFCAG